MSPDKKLFSLGNLLPNLRRKESIPSEAQELLRIHDRERFLHKYPLSNVDLWIALAVRKRKDMLHRASDLSDCQKVIEASLRIEDINAVVTNLVTSPSANISLTDLAHGTSINTHNKPFFDKVCFNYGDELSDGTPEEQSVKIITKVEKELLAYKNLHQLSIMPREMFNETTNQPERVWIVSAKTIFDFEDGDHFGIVNEFTDNAKGLLRPNEIFQVGVNKDSQPQIISV